MWMLEMLRLLSAILVRVNSLLLLVPMLRKTLRSLPPAQIRRRHHVTNEVAGGMGGAFEGARCQGWVMATLTAERASRLDVVMMRRSAGEHTTHDAWGLLSREIAFA